MTVTVLDDGPLVRATVDLPGGPPGAALAAFTDPATLARWWGGGQLTVTLAPGGAYTIHFPGPAATLTGQVIAYDPPSALAFTWAWQHEPGAPPRTVEVSDAGTLLSISHGPHGDSPAEQQARAGHRQGWEHFLPRLAALLTESHGA
jgi:uncharacterized protein YndB with AHSA1/START domain